MEILQTVIEGGAAVVGGVFLGAALSLGFFYMALFAATVPRLLALLACVAFGKEC